MKLGLLGGTFDPIHRGHVEVAVAALATGLDRVVFVPARKSPHKDRNDIIDPFHRFALAALATAGQEKIGVSSFEVLREGPSYTIDTVRHFTAAGNGVTLVMGTDSLAEVETWRQGHELLDTVDVIAYPRRPFVGPHLQNRLPSWVTDRVGRSIKVLEAEPADVSSTEIRQRLAAGQSIRDLVPEQVEEYILKNSLYGGGGNQDW